MLTTTQTKMKSPPVRVIGLVGLAVLALVFFTAAKPAVQASDAETCADCHEDVVNAFTAQTHSAADSCTACHGDAEIHLEEGGGANIFAFKETDAANAKTKKCLDCHTKSNSQFFASSHAKAALDCTGCHSVHGKTKLHGTKSCTMCHEDVFAQFQMNERHRLQEGLLDCTTCHDPHAPALRERLGGFKHESCLKCHTDKSGPYLYEHDASRVEGCSSCHVAHGSPNRHMLTHQSVSDLCFSCHTAAISWHARFDSETTNCVVCHSTIHGSNLSEIFLK